MKSRPGWTSCETDWASLAVIGLGYVGFPLAIHFGQHFKTFGYDSKQKRVDQIERGRY